MNIMWRTELSVTIYKILNYFSFKHKTNIIEIIVGLIARNPDDFLSRLGTSIVNVLFRNMWKSNVVIYNFGIMLRHLFSPGAKASFCFNFFYTMLLLRVHQDRQKEPSAKTFRSPFSSKLSCY